MIAKCFVLTGGSTSTYQSHGNAPALVVRRGEAPAGYADVEDELVRKSSGPTLSDRTINGTTKLKENTYQTSVINKLIHKVSQTYLSQALLFPFLKTFT